MQDKTANINNIRLWEKVIKGIITGVIIIGIAITIISFLNDFVLGGVLSIIIIFSTICVGTRWGEQISNEMMKKISIGLASTMLIISVISIISIQPITGSLDKDNFKRAFNYEFSSITSAIIGGELCWEITPKTEEYAKNPNSSDEITLVVKYSFTGGSEHYQNVTIKLYKSEGYCSKGKVKIDGSFTYVKDFADIVSVSGSVYK